MKVTTFCQTPILLCIYSLGEEQAFHLVTYRDTNDPQDTDGFFLLLLAPRPDAEQEAVPKDVILVLDRSGSMEGEKFQQARQALGYILKQLNPEDRFNVIAFSTGLESYADQLRPATGSRARQLSGWIVWALKAARISTGLCWKLQQS